MRKYILAGILTIIMCSVFVLPSAATEYVTDSQTGEKYPIYYQTTIDCKGRNLYYEHLNNPQQSQMNSHYGTFDASVNAPDAKTA